MKKLLVLTIIALLLNACQKLEDNQVTFENDILKVYLYEYYNNIGDQKNGNLKRVFKVTSSTDLCIEGILNNGECSVYFGNCNYKGINLEAFTERSPVLWDSNLDSQFQNYCEIKMNEIFKIDFFTNKGDFTFIPKFNFKSALINSDTQTKIGLSHLFFDDNQNEAFKWIKSAAEQGNASAQYILAGLYQLGIGIEKNEGEAALWFFKSGSYGEKESERLINSLFPMEDE